MLQNNSPFTFLGDDVVALPQMKRVVSDTRSPCDEITFDIFGEASEGGYDDLEDTGSESGVEAVEPTGVKAHAMPFANRMHSSTSLLSPVTTKGIGAKRPPSVSSSGSKASSSRTAVGSKRPRPSTHPCNSGFESDEDGDRLSRKGWSRHDVSQASQFSKIKRIMRLGPAVTWA